MAARALLAFQRGEDSDDARVGSMLRAEEGMNLRMVRAYLKAAHQIKE